MGTNVNSSLVIDLRYERNRFGKHQNSATRTMINPVSKILPLASFLTVLVAAIIATAQKETSPTVASPIQRTMQSYTAAGDFCGSVLVELTNSSSRRLSRYEPFLGATIVRSERYREFRRA